ncbi:MULTISPECIES: pentapeptide repeat-containing protein [Niastella]|uniref:Pentapeptide repeat-containing protein n=1 Tax=Niastella soli TaxID=2821487 RepID=A0ABS3Z2A8_9BACT|nr:pentapeptide repeat-containing protein [Niastella soli]MBO9203892.1 pentapeptide repeat-containing protein [Niastella soli]
MEKDFSHKNLKGASFKNEDLAHARFAESDLRGADFSGSNLDGADFTHVKTGITPINIVLIFLTTLVVSAFSGYVAMLAGQTVQEMLDSKVTNVRMAGIISIAITILFILISYWRGVGRAVSQLIIPAIITAFIIGIIAKVSGLGTGMGMLYLILSLVLVAVMFVVGTIARATAGALSNILFLIVAMSGAFFGRSVGGGIGTVIMALSCAIISKKALKGAPGFDSLRRIAAIITRKYGTSFRNSRLTDADFSRSHLHNSDFSEVDTSAVHWGNSKKINCISNEKILA